MTTNSSIRRQLTLFPDSEYSSVIESIRETFNPKQRSLINCHVTLCREDDIGDMVTVLNNLRRIDRAPLEMRFDRLQRFGDGKGVLMPASDGEEEFDALRRVVLADLPTQISLLRPHITLMHPRNAVCTDEIFDKIKKRISPVTFRFESITLIEQVNGGKWDSLTSFKLKKNPI